MRDRAERHKFAAKITPYRSGESKNMAHECSPRPSKSLESDWTYAPGPKRLSRVCLRL